MAAGALAAFPRLTTRPVASIMASGAASSAGSVALSTQRPAGLGLGDTLTVAASAASRVAVIVPVKAISSTSSVGPTVVFLLTPEKKAIDTESGASADVYCKGPVTKV